MINIEIIATMPEVNLCSSSSINIANKAPEIAKANNIIQNQPTIVDVVNGLKSVQLILAINRRKMIANFEFLLDNWFSPYMCLIVYS